jgi:putative sterol carrier protein
MNLIQSWEMLGGIPGVNICAYVDNHLEFETNSQYNHKIEKSAEQFYQGMAKRVIAFPSSIHEVKKNVLRSRSLTLTPQESEQLSTYVSDDKYVKKQKEDIEELANMFKGMLGGEENSEKYIEDIKKNFHPVDNLKAVFQIEVSDENVNLVIEINNKELNCYYGVVKNADVTAKTTASIMESVTAGKRTFQSAFMSGEITVQGNFKVLRNFDMLFRFGK